MKKILLQLVLLVMLTMHGAAQGVAINANGQTASSSAMLDVSSTNKGLLMPRMHSDQRKAIVNPEAGLMVYDLDRQTFFMFDGAIWRPLQFTSEQSLPPVERTATYGPGETGSVFFGYRVSLFGDYAAVSSRNEDVNGHADQGVVYVYFKSNGIWNFQQKFTASDGVASMWFGSSVDIYDNTIVVGAENATVGGKEFAGAVYVFKRSGTIWTEQQKITMTVPEEGATFGNAVAVHGNLIIVGAPEITVSLQTRNGGAFLYEYSGNTWGLVKVLKPLINTDAFFGQAVDIYNTHVVIGSPKAKFSGTETGLVYVYSYNPATGDWPQTVITSPQGQHGVAFGCSVSMNSTKVLIGLQTYSEQMGGTTYDQSGLAVIYKRTNNIWSLDSRVESTYRHGRAGSAVAMDDNGMMVSATGAVDGKGVVIVKRDDHYNRHLQDVDLANSYYYGMSVAISGNNFIISSPLKNGGKGSVFFGSFE